MHLEVTEQTYYRWRNQYGGMKADDAKRLKELEGDNQRLKRIAADQALDIDMLEQVKCGNFLSPKQRRAAVNFLVTRVPFSQRRVCRLLEQPRSTHRLNPIAPSDFERALRARLRELAASRPRYGYRRIHGVLNREGFRVNHKRVQRLCRD